MMALLADMAVWPIFVVFGGMVVAGVLATAGLVWLGFWLVQRGRRKADPVAEDEW